ncbi:ABC-type transport auxiliary lipoprotein family protein [Sphingomonas sp. LY29]|uniref:ABC-type transport auxiliary lipoprotein family protein n=1 Tax=Sphingomonas sp. LY29 TaxID=3095341 RepID=UPI002D775BAD|nr:ABC-type transport auxiliary lipoprotein family protein [Sphingomonas sp. LY29]WRP25184.1 ABC-type transport auxiliary lipoprotein family protein [Sphingomonas sp. LY29]
MRTPRLALVGLTALSLAACFGGKKVPPTLLTLTSAAPAPAAITRSATPGEAITIDVPVIPKEISTTRVPALVGPTAVAYIENLQWVETPDRLFQDLVQETVMRTTSRVVLDPRQASLDPGLKLTGNLTRFGYDTATQSVVVRYDGALSRDGGTRVETRRFEASVPADGTALTVGPALNAAANQVASQIASWVAN